MSALSLVLVLLSSVGGPPPARAVAAAPDTVEADTLVRGAEIPEGAVRPSAVRDLSPGALSRIREEMVASGSAGDTVTRQVGEISIRRLGDRARLLGPADTAAAPDPGTGGSGDSLRSMLTGPGTDGPARLYVLPVEYRVEATPTSLPEPASLQAAVQLGRGGLRLRDPDIGYTGELLLALMDTRDPTAIYGLARPVPFQFTAPLNSIDPHTLSLERAGLPFRRIHLSGRPSTDTVQVRIFHAADVKPVTLPVPVHRPDLEITRTPSAIHGFGLGTTEIRVTLPEGVQLDEDQRWEVRLATDQGRLDSTSLMVRPGRSEVTRLRSAGLGTATVTVRADLLDEASTTIPFGWPVSFLVAVLLGGLVGGGIRLLRSDDEERRGRAFRALALGVLAGLAATVGHVVGVQLEPLRALGASLPTWGGEALYFAVSVGVAMRWPRDGTA